MTDHVVGTTGGVLSEERRLPILGSVELILDAQFLL